MKDVLTTGEVARLCGVAPRTVSKWFDSGQLRGFKIPGSRDRRIPRDSLVRFMRAHGIPLKGLDGATTRVLIVDSDYDQADAVRAALRRRFDYEVQVGTGVFEAGLMAREFCPHVIFLDVTLPGLNAESMRQALKGNPELVATRVVAVVPASSNGLGEALLKKGFDDYLSRPFSLADLVRVIEEATNILL